MPESPPESQHPEFRRGTESPAPRRGTESPAPRRGTESPAPRRGTYRLQLRPEFGFDDAAGLVEYLVALGVSHVYLSPILQAAPGSTHGYDVIDPTALNADLGGAPAYERLAAAVSGAGLRQLVDIVPNHMSVAGPGNRWWWDVLENGPASAYAGWFDVDWDPPESKLRNVVLLPILGDHYGRELEAGRLSLEREGGRFVVRYFDHAAPVSPRTVGTLLDRAGEQLDATTPAAVELASAATAFARLPEATTADPDGRAERQRDKEILGARLAALCDRHADVAAAVDGAAAALSADIEALDRFLDRQNYRLAWWRTAGEELDYRRFFDINDLAAVRVEDPAVFAQTHDLVLGLIGAGTIDGLRIDHIDGLRDPAAYLARLQAAAPGTWTVVEKILEGEERLPGGWPVAGTTGYDWLNLIGGALSDEVGSAALIEGYGVFSGLADRYEEVVHAAKVEILDGGLAADLNRLVERLTVICERHRRHRDYTRRNLRDALAAVMAGFGVYRTYVRPGEPAGAVDVTTVEAAVLDAGIRRPDLDEELLTFVRDLLLGRLPGREEIEFAARAQQLTGPVMAKAVEDTAFYRYLPISWRNEVGGDPGRLGVTVAELHRANREAQLERPEALLALSTHDTKRSEDVRARLSVLAELPAEWQATVDAWRAHHRQHRQAAPPDGNTEWLIYETIVGAWPIDADRLVAYLGKATREAKLHTSWTDADPFYDEQLEQWTRGALADPAFVASVEDVVARLRRPGWTVALAQKLATLTAPGIPDLYQGTEAWDLSLVDPDNRRPVDYSHRRALLDAAAGMTVADAWAAEDGSGLAKVALVRAALALRAEHPDWFGGGGSGRYDELVAEGSAADHLIAWCRGGGAVTVLTRTPVRLETGGGWGDTALTLPPGRWLDRLTGDAWEGTVPAGELLARLPVALLVAEPA